MLAFNPELDPLPSSVCSTLFLLFLQKICLANHIRSLADLPHADVIQQLEVALLGSPADHLIYLLSTGLRNTASTSQLQVVHPPRAFTTPPPCCLCLLQSQLWVSLMLLLQLLCPVTLSSQEGQEIPSKCHRISPMLISQPDVTSRPLSPSRPSPSDTSTSFPIVVVPEVVIPEEAYPKHVNRLGGGKDYICHLCSFQHTNYDCLLTHIHKHLSITIGCPSCGHGFQNAASLHKHGRKVHQIRIVAYAEEQCFRFLVLIWCRCVLHRCNI